MAINQNEFEALKREVAELRAFKDFIFHGDRFRFIRPVELDSLAVPSKFGVFGVTPVDQPAAVSDPTISGVSGGDTVSATAISTNFTNLENAVEAIIDRLQELGLIA